MPLSQTVIDGLAQYYDHRARTNADTTGTITWDKDADLEKIFAAAEAAGFSTEASCGTFWFSSKTEHIRMTERNYLIGGEAFDDGTAFGALAEIAEALSKARDE